MLAYINFSSLREQIGQSQPDLKKYYYFHFKPRIFVDGSYLTLREERGFWFSSDGSLVDSSANQN